MKKGIDYIGNCVVYFCHDGQGNYVLNKRGINSRDEQGAWDCGGGGIEVGDSVIDTMIALFYFHFHFHFHFSL